MMQADAAEITALSTATWVDIRCSRLGTELGTEAGTEADTEPGTAVVVGRPLVLSHVTNTVNKSALQSDSVNSFTTSRYKCNE